MNRSDLQQLAEYRLDEAIALLDLKKYAGAYYLAGYAVECALKACIAKQTQEFDFPEKKQVNDSWTHNLGQLVNLARLQKSLRDTSDESLDFAANWSKTQEWNEHSRYQSAGEISARDLINAISDKENGVLQWVKQYW